MIHLIRDYYLNVDRQSGGCYIVGKAQSCVSERVLLSRTRYYTTLSVALASTAEIALRDAYRRRGCADLAADCTGIALHSGRDHSRCRREGGGTEWVM